MSLAWALLAGALAAAPALPAEQETAVRAAYEKLGSAAVESRPARALPIGYAYRRIDVSEPIRSASFGHTITLVVPVALTDGGTNVPNQFWVEYGRSTNTPSRLFGPFAIACCALRAPPGGRGTRPPPIGKQARPELQLPWKMRPGAPEPTSGACTRA